MKATLVAACLARAVAFSAAPHRPRASLDVDASIRLRSTAGDDDHAPSRRSVFVRTASAASAALAAATLSAPANAGIDPSALRALPVEGDATGAASRLRQIESENGPRPEDSKDIAFERLPSGASYREYREGKGDAAVGPGSKVAAEMTIRCLSFATANEPGGLKYFSTKEDTDFNELAWTVGSGELPPELEECMMGMHKGAVRRIELPSTVVFAARKNGQLPLPSDKNKDGKRRFENLFKTDATLLFEVFVTRIK
ncbi:hypothetical protein ACHAWF_010459 [Thalassiosira exigua]